PISLLFLIVFTTRPPPLSTLFPYTTLFRSRRAAATGEQHERVLAGGRLRQRPRHLAQEPRPPVGVEEPAVLEQPPLLPLVALRKDRKSTRLNSSHVEISYAVFCLKKKKNLQ